MDQISIGFHRPDYNHISQDYLPRCLSCKQHAQVKHLKMASNINKIEESFIIIITYQSILLYLFRWTLAWPPYASYNLNITSSESSACLTVSRMTFGASTVKYDSDSKIFVLFFDKVLHSQKENVYHLWKPSVKLRLVIPDN